MLSSSFESTVEIDITITEAASEDPIDHIMIHSKCLKYKSITIESLDKNIIIPDEYIGTITPADDYVDETYRLRFKHKDDESSYIFKTGDYKLKFEYHGSFTQSENGLYTCSDRRFQKNLENYNRNKNKSDVSEEEKLLMKNEYLENTVICTSLEPAACRTIMPCFDEPIFKAVFEVILNVTHPSHVAISNSKVKSIEKWEGGNWYCFHDTPYMSTYLLCLIIGKFEYIESILPSSGAQIRVYVPCGRTKQGEFALDITARTLLFYEDFFGIPYPLDKLDIVSLHEMDVRAMENWGCITFNEPALLMDVDSTPTNVVIRNARTICHEVAHMWFGNLVTLEWWTDIWLNEGFARFAEFFALDSFIPEGNNVLKAIQTPQSKDIKTCIWDQFLNEVFVDGITQDGGYNSHPVEVECTSPSNLRDIFDGIAYAKGSSLIRMINEYLGNETFQIAVKYYIKNNLYSNTQTCDLWKVFEDTSKDESFTSMMKQWTQQKGFPIITANMISKTENCQTWKLTQESCHKSDNFKWIIPLTYITSKGNRGSIILSEDSQDFDLELENDEIVKFNDKSATFCLIKYGKDEIK